MQKVALLLVAGAVMLSGNALANDHHDDHDKDHHGHHLIVSQCGDDHKNHHDHHDKDHGDHHRF